MKRIITRCLLAAGILLLLLGVLLGSLLFYLARNPSLVKQFAVEHAAGILDLDIEIRELDWGLDPLRVEARGIAVSSTGPESEGFHVGLDGISAEMSLEGEFGDRTLVVHTVSIQSPELHLSDQTVFALPPADSGEPSWAARAAGAVFNRAAFRRVRMEEAVLSGGRAVLTTGSMKAEIKAVDARLSSSGDLSASCSASIDLTDSGSSVTLPDIRTVWTVPLGAGRENLVRGRFATEGGFLTDKRGKIQGLDLHALLDFDPVAETVLVRSLTAETGDIRPFLPMDLPEPLGVRMKTEALVDLSGRILRDGNILLSVVSPGTEIRLKGFVKAAWAAIPTASLESLELKLAPRDIAAMLPPGLREKMEPIKVQGEIALKGALHARLEDSVTVSPDLSILFENNLVEILLPEGRVQGVISGGIHAKGPWPESILSADLRAGDVRLEHPPLRHAPAEVHVRLKGTRDKLGVEVLEIKAPGITLGQPGEGAALEEIQVTAEGGVLRPTLGAFSLPALRLASKGAGPVTLAVAVDSTTRSIQAAGENAGLLHLLSTMDERLSPYGIQGRESFRLEATQHAGGPWTFSSTLALGDLAMENAELELYGEGIQASLELEGTYEQGAPRLSLSSLLRVTGGEVLYDRFYLDMGQAPARLDLEAVLLQGNSEIRLPGVKFELKDLLSVKVAGTCGAAPEGPLADLSLYVPPFHMGPVYRKFVAEPYQMDAPALASLTVDGSASGSLNLRLKGEDMEIRGAIRVTDGLVSSEESNLALRGLDLSLPVWFTKEGIPVEADDPPRGHMSVQALEAPYLQEQPLSLQLEAAPNRFRVQGPNRIQVMGGEMELGDVLLTYSADSGFSAETSLKVDRMPLGPLLANLWPGSPQGYLEGALNPVRFAGGTITSQGGFTGRIFGGDLLIRNVGLARLFSPGPLVSLDAEWRGLNLDQMTNGTEFGRVTGILEGNLEDFRLAYGQPQRFDLLLETVDRPGIEQRISVEAVENISRLGGGGSPFVGMAGFFAGLFSDFAYEKIGIHATLKNDVFQINGTVHEGGTEYLVKRGGISGVNVVNQNPDNRISFKDMVKRIQRIFESKGGPVIR